MNLGLNYPSVNELDDSRMFKGFVNFFSQFTNINITKDIRHLSFKNTVKRKYFESV